jgi:aminocarboxymuconate-semialdehyde decarboxylase
VHYLIFDGVLERHPNLKILAVHGGGYLGAYWGRIDHAWGARADCKADLPNPPTSYLKKIYFDSVVFTPGQLENLVETWGVDNVVMGTDYPFDMADYDPVGHVVSSKLDESQIAAICGGNASGSWAFDGSRLCHHRACPGDRDRRIAALLGVEVAGTSPAMTGG